MQPQTRTSHAKKSQTQKTSTRFSVATPSTYTVKSTGEEKTYWTNIGSAFFGAKGISIELNALPINGKMFISTQEQEN